MPASQTLHGESLVDQGRVALDIWLSVLKSRGMDHSTEVRILRLSEAGIESTEPPADDDRGSGPARGGYS